MSVKIPILSWKYEFLKFIKINIATFNYIRYINYYLIIFIFMTDNYSGITRLLCDGGRLDSFFHALRKFIALKKCL